MFVELSKAQFDALVKEALDGMSDVEYVAFARKIASEAKLRGLKADIDTRGNFVEKRVSRTRDTAKGANHA